LPAAERTASRARRVAAFTLRFATARRFFGTFGRSRRAPRTTFRAAPVATSAAPAAVLVAVDAAEPAAALIVSPAVVMMPFFAIARASAMKLIWNLSQTIPAVSLGSGLLADRYGKNRGFFRRFADFTFNLTAH
jgi:hypothetical protein